MKGIRIEKLFGRFDYEIELKPGGMTILTGPNGFGKSTIIRCIEAISNSDLDYFFELDFEEIEILGDEQPNLLIQKKADALIVCGYAIDRRINAYRKRAILRRADEELVDEGIDRMMVSYRSIIELMQQSIGKVVYIEEQRLLQERESALRASNGTRRIGKQLVHTVESIPRKLQIKMHKVSSEYSSVANELDSTYPERLFNQADGIGEEEFDPKMDVMMEKFEKLNKYGVSNIKKLQDIKFKQEDARALKVYFDDFDKKYAKYEPLIEELDLFTEMVNRRFLFKHLEISAETGTRVVDDSGREISLLKLSSGEKETLVLFYQLLFEVPDGVLLLVDEPEISLHVKWQRMFAEDLHKIVSRKNINVIVATHSAQIVNGNRRIQIDLGEMYKNGLNKGKSGV